MNEMIRFCEISGANYFSCSPSLAVLTDEQGGEKILEIHNGNRFLLQRELARFFKKGLPKLRMTWGKEPGSRKHIVLLQENGRFLMAWVQEREDSTVPCGGPANLHGCGGEEVPQEHLPKPGHPNLSVA